jgi:hypothetical protein
MLNVIVKCNTFSQFFTLILLRIFPLNVMTFLPIFLFNTFTNVLVEIAVDMLSFGFFPFLFCFTGGGGGGGGGQAPYVPDDNAIYGYDLYGDDNKKGGGEGGTTGGGGGKSDAQGMQYDDAGHYGQTDNEKSEQELFQNEKGGAADTTVETNTKTDTDIPDNNAGETNTSGDAKTEDNNGGEKTDGNDATGKVSSCEVGVSVTSLFCLYNFFIYCIKAYLII